MKRLPHATRRGLYLPMVRGAYAPHKNDRLLYILGNDKLPARSIGMLWASNVMMEIRCCKTCRYEMVMVAEATPDQPVSTRQTDREFIPASGMHG
jgi:hypothetical protein